MLSAKNTTLRSITTLVLLAVGCSANVTPTPHSPAKSPPGAEQALANGAGARQGEPNAASDSATETSEQTKLREEAERAAWIRVHYEKREARVPMRDGSRLHTIIYSPRKEGKRYPFLLRRTPYSVAPYGEHYARRLGADASFEKEGFIFVLQDVRGRFMSEGDFVNMRPHIEAKSAEQIDESTDTYDTIEWLLENVDNHNGKVGLTGISYPGFYAAAGMIDSHPALAAVSPQAPIADWYFDDFHRQGAFVLPMAFNFFSGFGVVRKGLHQDWPERLDHGTDDGYRFFLELGPLRNANEKYLKGKIPFWNAIADHPDYDDYWQARNLLPHLKNVSAAVLTVGGWYDTEDLYGPPRIYQSTEKHNPGIDNRLVMGPWTHGAWHRTEGDKIGAIEFEGKHSTYFRQQVELPFFVHHLKSGPAPKLPEALVFETGANRWRGFDSWPPAAATPKSLYLHENRQLSFDAPSRSGRGAFDSYLSDPHNPVPYTAEITSSWAKEYVVEDQRFAGWRPDVLVYESEPLTDSVTLAGLIEVELFASTTGRDTDFVVKLIDVHPGRSQAAVEAFASKQKKELAERLAAEKNLARLAGDDLATGLAAAEADYWQQQRSKRPVDRLSHYQQLVRAEAFRGRYRDGYDKPRPFRPGKVEKISFKLWDQFHTFKKGHRIQVQVQSTWFPFIDRNPQSWVSNIFEAKAEDFIAVTNKIYRSKRYPSRLKVRVLPPGASKGERPPPPPRSKP